MPTPKQKDLEIRQGSTFEEVVYWETEPVIYKAITAISQTAPARLTVVGHGLVNNWRVAIVSVKGMTGINAQNSPPKEKDYIEATVIDVDTIELNSVNAADFKAYTNGGYIQYNTPKSLAGFIARMSCKDKVGGAEFLRLDTTNSGIAIDNAAKTITIRVTASASALLAKRKGVYDLELESPSGVVTPLLAGAMSVSSEVTTT